MYSKGSRMERKVSQARISELQDIEALRGRASPAGRRRHRHDVAWCCGRVSPDDIGTSAVLRVEVGCCGVDKRSAHISFFSLLTSLTRSMLEFHNASSAEHRSKSLRDSNHNAEMREETFGNFVTSE